MKYFILIILKVAVTNEKENKVYDYPSLWLLELHVFLNFLLNPKSFVKEIAAKNIFQEILKFDYLPSKILLVCFSDLAKCKRVRSYLKLFLIKILLTNYGSRNLWKDPALSFRSILVKQLSSQGN